MILCHGTYGKSTTIPVLLGLGLGLGLRPQNSGLGLEGCGLGLVGFGLVSALVSNILLKLLCKRRRTYPVIGLLVSN